MQKIKLKIEPRTEARHEAFTYQADAFMAVKDLEYAGIFHEQTVQASSSKQNSSTSSVPFFQLPPSSSSLPSCGTSDP